MSLYALALLLPLAALVIAVLGRNWPSFRAGLLALALLAGVVAWIELATGLPNGLTLPGWAWRGLAEGTILTGMVVETLLFGLLLHRLMEASGRLDVLLSLVRNLGRGRAERLLWVLVVIGPFFESISGFGLGVVIVVPMLAAMGYAPIQVMVLSLLTQLAVPWGALAIGMGLGATMTGIGLAPLGQATALLSALIYPAFWVTALVVGLPTRGERLRALPVGCVALAVFAGAVWAANRWVSPELGGVVGAPVLALWLQLTGAGLQRGNGELRTLLRGLPGALLPYGVLAALLIVTRYHDVLGAWLNAHAVLRLPGSSFALPLLYNPGASLLLACLVAGWGILPARLPGLLAAAAGQWWGAARAVFVLILVARLLEGAGLVQALTGLMPAGGGAVVTPVAVACLAALGGFLTGSVAGANALFINVQTALAGQAGLPLLWAASVQNLTAAASTALSPARLVFAATMTGRHGEEGKALRRLLPLGAAIVALGAAALLPGVVDGLRALEPWAVQAPP